MLIKYFTAPWCGPCKTFGPRLEEFAFVRGLTVEKINVEEDMDQTRKFEIMSLPTTIWFEEDGTHLATKVGPLSDDQLKMLAGS